LLARVQRVSSNLTCVPLFFGERMQNKDIIVSCIYSHQLQNEITPVDYWHVKQAKIRYLDIIVFTNIKRFIARYYLDDAYGDPYFEVESEIFYDWNKEWKWAVFVHQELQPSVTQSG
jgi:hypothetical protein